MTKSSASKSPQSSGRVRAALDAQLPARLRAQDPPARRRRHDRPREGLGEPHHRRAGAPRRSEPPARPPVLRRSRAARARARRTVPGRGLRRRGGGDRAPPRRPGGGDERDARALPGRTARAPAGLRRPVHRRRPTAAACIRRCARSTPQAAAHGGHLGALLRARLPSRPRRCRGAVVLPVRRPARAGDPGRRRRMPGAGGHPSVHRGPDRSRRATRGEDADASAADANSL